LFPAGEFVFSQGRDSPSPEALFAGHYHTGVNLYQQDRWMEAVSELRQAQEAALTHEQWTESLYWIIITELSLSDFGSAVRDMDELDRYAPNSRRATDLLYHRARAYYYLGYYDDAIVLFTEYSARAGEGDEIRKIAAAYWIGECFFALDQFERAAECFNQVAGQQPKVPKYEAAIYRLEQIRQKMGGEPDAASANITGMDTANDTQ
jgi:TolA-binding protein